MVLVVASRGGEGRETMKYKHIIRIISNVTCFGRSMDRVIERAGHGARVHKLLQVEWLRRAPIKRCPLGRK